MINSPSQTLDLTKTIRRHHESTPDKVMLGGIECRRHVLKQVLVFDDKDELYRVLTDEFKKSLIDHPDKGVIFPADRTHQLFYKRLVDRADEFRPLLAPNMHSNLDELYPLTPEDKNWPIAFINYMRERIIRPLKLEDEQWIIPDSTAEDPGEEVIRTQINLRSVNWGTALLGIGPDANGKTPASSHIGFIQKGTPIYQGVSHVTLDAGTVTANRSEAPDPYNYPTEAITQGPGNIGDAERIILTAVGSNKKNNIADTLLEMPTLDKPSSLIHVLSDDVTVLLDKKSAETVARKLGISL